MLRFVPSFLQQPFCIRISLEQFFSKDPLSGWTKIQRVGQYMTKAIGFVFIGGAPINTLAYSQYLTHGQHSSQWTKAKALCFHWRWMSLLSNASAMRIKVMTPAIDTCSHDKTCLRGAAIKKNYGII